MSSVIDTIDDVSVRRELHVGLTVTIHEDFIHLAPDLRDKVGTVKKVNPKKAKVDFDDRTWNIPHRMIQPL